MVSESTGSLWQQRAQHPRTDYPTLAGDLKADVVIVGAGITGLTAAVRLQQVGARVIVLELNCAGSGTTSSSTGHLDVLPDRNLHTLLDHLGIAGTRRVLDARQSAIDHVEQNVRQFHIDCQFRRVPGYLYAQTPDEVALLEREQEAADRLELLVERRSQAPLPFETQSALRLPNQARFDPAAYVRGMAGALVDLGGRLYENTAVERIEPGASGKPAAAMTNHGIVTADAIILAGHAPMLGLFSAESRVVALDSYVLAVRVADAPPDALYWDAAQPYHYTRLIDDDEADLLLVGGADHPTGERPAEDPLAKLERYVHERYDVRAVEARWSHELWESADGLPFIGSVPQSHEVYIATGLGGEGLSYGTVAGLLLSDQVLGRENSWTSVFDPGRTNLAASSRHMLAQMMHVTKHYLGDRLAGGEVERPDQIQPGQGALVSVEGRKLAVYREPAGTLHAMSPVCRHRGCLVHWNEIARTWDCPCHGGRYDATGNVIAGPPREPLVRESLGARA